MEGIGYLFRMLLEAALSVCVSAILIGLFIAGVVLGYAVLGVIAVVAFAWILLYGIYHIILAQVVKWRANWFF